jgi:4-diphosphocytidyl-2-C-methyl-D-erythritol kinase
MSLPQDNFEQQCILEAPAKLNLRLKVTGRRADGYHLLSMLNVGIDLHDTVKIILTKEPGINVSVSFEDLYRLEEGIELENSRKNLAARAVSKFREEFAFNFGAKIEIIKRIPLGAGLGGGSGNAAAVLNFLKAQYDTCKIKDFENRFLKLALSLGADVPYMLEMGLGEVSGVGEKIKKLPNNPLQGEPIFLLFPNFGINTAQIFSDLRSVKDDSLYQDLKLIDIMKKYDSGSRIDRGDLIKLIDNDLIDFAVKRQPVLNEIITLLKNEFGIVVSMSGSGSTIFVLAKDVGTTDMVLSSKVLSSLERYKVKVGKTKIR